MADWTFLINHARVLLCIAHDPGVRLRDIAGSLSITERGATSRERDLIALLAGADARLLPPEGGCR